MWPTGGGHIRPLEGISDSWPWFIHLVTTVQPFKLSGSWPTCGTQITSVLCPPRELEVLQVQVFASIAIDAQGKQRDAGSGPGVKRWREGHRPYPLKGDQSWPTSSFPGAFKAFKDISGSDHCRECPKQSWKKFVTLAPAAPETRQPGYPKSRNKHFISTLQPHQETKV